MSDFFEMSAVMTAIAETHGKRQAARSSNRSSSTNPVGSQPALKPEPGDLRQDSAVSHAKMLRGVGWEASLVENSSFGVHPRRRLGDKAITSAILHNGKVVELVVPGGGLAKRIKPGISHSSRSTLRAS